MLQRSLILFLALVLLGTCLTAGYVILSLRGPDDTLAEAQELLRRGDAAAAVRILDLCEPGAGMRENPALQERLWRLRLEGNRRLDNPRRCLEDLEHLLPLAPGQADLELMRVFYLLREGKSARAREHALALVAAQPQLARAHELAGEACQQAYGDRLRELNKRLRTDLGHAREEDGIAAFLEFLYRPDGDAGGVAALLRLQQLYESEPRFRQAWPALQDELRALRERIQQAVGYFQKALELAESGQKTNDYYAAAYRGVAFALGQADRRDDVVAQAEIYLTNHDHRYCTDAAIDAVAAHMRDGQYEAAVELVDRYLPAKSWGERHRAGKLDESLQTLLVHEAFALYRLGRADRLVALHGDSAKLGAKLQLGLIPPLAGSLLGALRDNDPGIGPQLVAASNHFLDRPAPLDGDDPLDLLMPLRIAIARAGAHKPGELVETATAWARKRPGKLAPLRTRARLQIDTNQAAAAMATAGEILQAAPTDEAALRLLGEAADLAYAASGQDSDALLLQCLQRGLPRPDYPPHPVCLLLTGEAALRQNRPDIARACARAGADSFPWSQWPRSLEARAELAAGQTATALAVLGRVVDADPAAGEALALWFDVAARAGEPLRTYLPQVVRTQPSSTAIAAALLHEALDEQSPAATALARAAAARTDATAELLALAARALAQAGDEAAARNALQRSRQVSAAAPSPAASKAQALAAIAYIAAIGVTRTDGDLLGLAGAELQRTELGGPATAQALIAAAHTLAKLDKVRTAHLLVGNALALGDAIECRDADSFRFAGDLAIELQQFDVAAADYTAAISFPGGEQVAEPLARLLLLRGDRERASLVFARQPRPTDAALAVLAGRADAGTIADQRLRADTGDLLAALPQVVAVDGDAKRLGAELRTASEPHRTAALELAAILGEPALARGAIARARALLAALPESRAARLLLARALATAGFGAEAAELHGRVFAAGCRDLPFFGEAVRATTSPGYELLPALRTELRTRAQSAPASLPPLVLAFVLRDLATAAADAGNLPVAVTILTELWQRLPEASKASAADAQLLLGHGLLAAGAALLERLRTIGTAEERHRAGTLLYEAAIANNATLPPAAAEAMQRAALLDLERGELVGPALGFLLTDDRRLDALRPELVRRHVAALLHATAIGEAAYIAVPYALDYAYRRLGADAARGLVDEAIAAHPAMAGYWLERARLAGDSLTARQALGDARRLLEYTADHELWIDFVILAGEHRALVADDHARLAKVPAELLATPRGSYARGLAALRRGDAEAAEPLLAAAPVRPSGFHLWSRALANLMRRAPEARTRAAELLQQLVARYPSSSLARNAGSFARQLGPN